MQGCRTLCTEYIAIFGEALWLGKAACLQIVVARLLDIRHADVEGTICLRGEPVRGRGTCAGNAQRSRAVARRRGRQQSGQAGPRATPEAGLTRTARTDC